MYQYAPFAIDTPLFSSIIPSTGGDVMAHQFEYRLMQKWLTAIAISGTPNYSTEQARAELGKHLDIAAEGLPDAIDKRSGGGWDIDSHSLSFVGDSILLSVLLRRRRTETT